MASRLSLETSPLPIPRTLARARRRQLAAILVERSSVLPEDQRSLILEVFEHGRSILHIVRRQDPDPSTLPVRAARARRRVRALVRRMLSPPFETVRTRAAAWPPAMARVGHACFILGLSLRECSRQLDISIYNVRRHIQAIRTIATNAATPRDRAA